MSHALTGSEVSFDDPAAIATRIWEHRAGECRLEIETPAGIVERGEVRVSQRRHTFRFGANAFGLGKMGRLKETGRPDRPEAASTNAGAEETSADGPNDVLQELFDPVDPSALPQRVRRHAAEYDPVRHEDDLAFERRFCQLFNLAVLPFYEGAVSPEPDLLRLHRVAAMIQWAKLRGLDVKGHPLIFHDQRLVAPWLVELDESAYWRWIERRIQIILARFGEAVDLWDVINEPIDATPPSTGGPLEAITRAFGLVRSHRPRGQLTLNFNQREMFDPIVAPRTVELIQQLLDNDVQPDVLGVQAHFGRLSVESVDNVVRGLDAFREFGLPVHVTETTFGTGGENTATAEERQARDVEAFYSYLFSRPEVEAVIWWDLTDRHSFCQVGGLLRRNLSPKPAYDVIFDLIHRRWSTDVTCEIRDGRAQFRGYFGVYEAEIRLPDGSTEYGAFTLQPDTSLPIALRIGDSA